MDLKNMIEKANEKAVEVFRHLHMNPELSEQEKNTEDFICRFLEDLNIPYRRGVAGHGIIGLVSGKGDTCIGIRADIDALPVTENTNLPYQSQSCGVMHACGHDMHISILLGTAVVLKELADNGSLCGSVKLFFQPAEESIGGAHRMILEGALQDPAVSSVIGLHVDPSCEVGSLSFRSGPMNAAVDDFSATIRGKQCHGAHPENGIDPIVTAANIIMNLQTIASRSHAATEPVVVSIGQINGGTGCNIIPDEVKITGTLRALKDETLEFIKQKTMNIAKSTASMYGASVDFSWMNTPFPPLINNAEICGILNETVKSCDYVHTVHHMPEPSMGADDFAFFTNAVPGAYFNIGCTKPGKEWYPLHSDKFVAEPETILGGIEIEVRCALALLEK